MLHVLQVNLQHGKAATAALSQYLNKHQLDIALIEKPWMQEGRVAGCAKTKDKLFYDFTNANSRACIFIKN